MTTRRKYWLHISSTNQATSQVNAAVSPQTARNFGLNAYAWLASIVPAVFSSKPSTLVQDTGLLTNPVFVQDLAIWLPLLITAALATWRRQAWGILITGAMLAMFVLESIGIATDQWFGSQAAPLSNAASMSMVPVFAVVAVISALPLIWY